MDATITNQYSAVIARLSDQVKTQFHEKFPNSNFFHEKWFLQARSAIRDLDPTNDITFLRIRSKKNEVLLAPGKKTFLAKKKLI